MYYSNVRKYVSPSQTILDYQYHKTVGVVCNRFMSSLISEGDSHFVHFPDSKSDYSYY